MLAQQQNKNLQKYTTLGTQFPLSTIKTNIIPSKQKPSFCVKIKTETLCQCTAAIKQPFSGSFYFLKSFEWIYIVSFTTLYCITSEYFESCLVLRNDSKDMQSWQTT